MAPARKKLRMSGSSEAQDRGGDNVDHSLPATQEQQVAQRRSLFVRSLPASTTSESLTSLFSESFPIKHATAVIDPETKQCRGYGFVVFADAEDAERARTEFNGHVLEGRKLRVEIAEPRHRNDEKNTLTDKSKGSAKQVKQEPQLQQSRLIVRNLPWTVKTPEQLTALFLPYGKVKQAYLPKKPSGLLAGFGFVVLRGQKNAQKALESVNGKEVEGRTLAVDWAVKKEVYNEALQVGNSDAVGLDGTMHGKDNETNVEDDDTRSTSIEASEDDSFSDEDGSEDDGGVNVVETERRSESEDNSSTLFIRNLPFDCTEEDLEEHFQQFGDVRYARLVIDATTGRPKGTGFVCFYKKADTDTCLRQAPRRNTGPENEKSKDKQATHSSTSILQDETTDPTGKYTMNGRVLQVSRAVNKSEATRLTAEGAAWRHKRDEDKRRLYLLSEGTISSKSPLWEKLSPSERTMREASAKQRKALIDSNPSLHLSLTRLSVRNIPRSISSKQLKALARQAIVGFAADVKNGSRMKLSKEELSRGGDEMREAEIIRKKSGKGLVKQAKVVFEGAGGSKVDEDSGAGRSRGYGFIEYYTHRNALMGLRWLNGHAVTYQVQDGNGAKRKALAMQDRKKRLIVEFAIENAQVVKRRHENESKARERSRFVQDTVAKASDDYEEPQPNNGDSRKRKRAVDKAAKRMNGESPSRIAPGSREETRVSMQLSEKAKEQSYIIGRKRAMRRARKSGA